MIYYLFRPFDMAQDRVRLGLGRDEGGGPWADLRFGSGFLSGSGVARGYAGTRVRLRGAYGVVGLLSIALV